MNVYGFGFRSSFERRAGLRAAPRLAVLVSVFLLGVGGLMLAPALLASDGPEDTPADGGGNADSRGLRLSSVDGRVQVVQDGQVIADPAYANLPVFEGSQIISGNDGRAEIEMEDGSVIRLSPNSTITFPVLQQQGTNSRTEIVLNGGLAYFELQPSSPEHLVKVSYGTTTFSASSFSVVRVNLDEPPGDLAVFSGSVHLDRGNVLSLEVHGGESLQLDGSDPGRYNLAETIEPDSWDNWNADRDQVLNSEASQRTAASGEYGDAQNSNMSAGMSDLDANGNWYNVPGQGYVWSPYEAISAGQSWDPYGYGHWVYYPRYGYVWVSGYGWGYTPYQCGSWNFYDSFGWGWAPGGPCHAWWGGGGAGWGFNIGSYPRWYRFPVRPHPGPVRPHPGGPGSPVRVASIPVDRRPVGASNSLLATHTNQPVTIAGHVLQPLRPVAPRAGYDRLSNGFVSRSNSSNPAIQGTYGGQHAAYPAGYGSTGSRPYTPPQGSRPSAPAPTHSYSGGGGGDGHPSAPSGGGGGGGSHGGGGGGGGGTHK